MKNNSAIFLAFLLGFTATSCIKSPRYPGQATGSSKVTSVKMRVPTLIGTKDITGKLTGYTLRITKTGGSCEFAEIFRTESLVSGDIKIDAKLKQECDYAVLLSFGQISSDEKKLDKIFLTSDEFEGKPARPAIVKKEDLRDKTEVTVKACVSVTSVGATELGVNAADCPSITDNSLGNNVAPTPAPIGPTSPSLKLSKVMSGTAEGYEVFFSGEVTSVANASKFCVFAIDAYYEAPTPKLVVLEDSFLEIKAGEKLALNKSVTVDAGPLTGPLSFSELRLLEQCFDKRPENSVKALDLFTKCYNDKNCPVVGK